MTYCLIPDVAILKTWIDSPTRVRGFAIQTANSIYLPETDCVHFRVIAVDEDGNESAPGYPTDGMGSSIYPLPGCDTGPTLQAPTNLQVTTTAGFPCAYQLQWDDTANSGDEYYVYRYAIPKQSYVPYFYVTERVAAQSGSCGGATCTYVESGDPSYNSTDPSLSCPFESDHFPSDMDACPTGDHLQAFYVTIKSPTGGESPRSDIVFWDCNEDPEYAQLDLKPLPGRLSPNDVFRGYDGLAKADVPRNLGTSIAANQRPALESFFEPEVCELPKDDQWQATGTLLTLGQSSTDPPVEIIDIHVDHLGSTRLTTGDDGSIATAHNFMPFGEEILPVADSLTKMFTGHERDANTGLDYMLARYYGGSVGRFLAVDSYPGSARLSAPQRWNRYTYVRNNPLGLTDPNGLKAVVPDNAKATVRNNFMRSSTYRKALRAAAGQSQTVTFTTVSTVDKGTTHTGSGEEAVRISEDTISDRSNETGEITEMKKMTGAVLQLRAGQDQLGPSTHGLTHFNNAAEAGTYVPTDEANQADKASAIAAADAALTEDGKEEHAMSEEDAEKELAEMSGLQWGDKTPETAEGE